MAVDPSQMPGNNQPDTNTLQQLVQWFQSQGMNAADAVKQALSMMGQAGKMTGTPSPQAQAVINQTSQPTPFEAAAQAPVQAAGQAVAGNQAGLAREGAQIAQDQARAPGSAGVSSQTGDLTNPVGTRDGKQPPPPPGTPPGGPPTGGAASPPAGTAPAEEGGTPAATVNGPATPGTDPAAALAAGPGGAPGTQTLNPTSASTNFDNPNQYDWGYDPSRGGLTQWSQRVFQHATGIGDNGGSINPYQQWVKQQYGNSLPISSYLHYLTNGDTATGPGGAGPQTTSTINAFTTPDHSMSDQGITDLRTLADMSQRVHDNQTAGMDEPRVDSLHNMNSEQGAGDAESMMLAAYQRKYGNITAGEFMNRLDGLRNQYFGNSTLASGPTPFLNFLIKNTNLTQ